MAIDPRISLAGQVTDVAGNITSGLANRNTQRTQGVREQILSQQAQAGAMQNAQTQGAYVNQLATNLLNEPLDERAAIVAQQLPLLSQMGIDPQKIIGGNLSDQGLQGVIAQTQPFVSQVATQAAPAAIQTSKYYQGILANPNSTDDQVKAARIALKLDAPAREFAPKLVEIGGVKYMQQGANLYNPQTFEPVAVDDTGKPVTPLKTDDLTSPVEPVPTQTLTPDQQTTVLEATQRGTV